MQKKTDTSSEQERIMTALNDLQAEIAELKEAVFQLIPAKSHISIIEKARIIREAHLSGNPAQIRKAHKLINRKR